MNKIKTKDERLEITRNVEFARTYFKQKLGFEISAFELYSRLNDEEAEDLVVIDVRDLEDFADFHIPGSINIPSVKINKKIEKLDKSKVHIVYDRDDDCEASTRVALTLTENGIPVMELSGGFETWNKRSFPVESGIRK